MIDSLLKKLLFFRGFKKKTNKKENKYVKKSQFFSRISCDKCNGNYIMRTGKYSDFAGCTNYPKCKSIIKVHDYVFKYIEENGVDIYKWNKICWKCKELTCVYSYYLGYELEEFDEYFSGEFWTPGLGDLPFLDACMTRKFKTIKFRYSNTTKSGYISNGCIHCGALQGKNYVVDDPHEIMGSLIHKKDMEKYWYDTIMVNTINDKIVDIDGCIYNKCDVLAELKSYYKGY